MSVKGWGFGSDYRSSYNWEDSYYGGYSKVLRDLPDIRINFNFEVDISKVADGSDLSYSNLKKLGKLFLLKIKQYNLTENFLLAIDDVEIVKYGFSRKVHMINPEANRMVLNEIIASDPELSNLFKNYKDEILGINYYHEVYGESEEEFNGRTLSDKQQIFRDYIDNINKVPEYKYTGVHTSNSLSNKDLKKANKFLQARVKEKPTIYTGKQTIAAGQLVNLLDIDFDPNISVVKNIKAGKLDITKIAEIIPGNTNVYYKTEINQTTKPFSVCILCDESGSMKDHTYNAISRSKLKKIEAQHEVVKILHKAFSEILPPDKLYVLGHSGYTSPEVTIYQDKYNNNFDYVIDDMIDYNPHFDVSSTKKNLANNYDGPAIECVYEKIRKETDDNIIFIAISDGNPAGFHYGGETAIEELKRIIEKCKRDGFVTVGIGLDHGAIKDIYNYHCIVQDVDTELVKKASQLINTVVKTEFK